ncbi:MAG: GNAT family N-acetyltransferase [Candidatus Brockarchaeota archaeon]|nr:GNAT family N-acetyltransferase [Candidatus Brockarchaeota archaeon]
MKVGEILRRFKAKDGREVVLRAPKWGDLDGLMQLINSLVEEGAEIEYDAKKTRDEEVDWLSRSIAQLEKGNALYLVAEVDGRVVASSGVTRRSAPCESHVGDLGIVVKAGYRDVGIGTEVIRTLIEEARAMGLKILVLTVFATNERAIHVYEKAGFRQTGRIPNGIFRNGKYVDRVIMVKEMF